MARSVREPLEPDRHALGVGLFQIQIQVQMAPDPGRAELAAVGGEALPLKGSNWPSISA